MDSYIVAGQLLFSPITQRFRIICSFCKSENIGHLEMFRHHFMMKCSTCFIKALQNQAAQASSIVAAKSTNKEKTVQVASCSGTSAETKLSKTPVKPENHNISLSKINNTTISNNKIVDANHDVDKSSLQQNDDSTNNKPLEPDTIEINDDGDDDDAADATDDFQSDKKPFKCECGASFKYIFQLRIHRIENVHIEKVEYKCTSCNKNFQSSYELKMHLKSTIHVGLFECPICSKHFQHIRHLRDHRRRVHDKVKPFKCQNCNKSFFRPGELKRHKRTQSCFNVKII